MVASSINGAGIIPQVDQSSSEGAVTYNSPKRELKTKEEIGDNISVEEYVRSYFSDVPVLAEVAKCESHFRQYDKNGNVLRGRVNEFDRGVMQINEHFHLEESDKYGYDIMTIEGNLSYARMIFEKQGLRPWKSSSPCWSKTAAYAEYSKTLAMK